jgi:hypothetical protein
VSFRDSRDVQYQAGTKKGDGDDDIRNGVANNERDMTRPAKIRETDVWRMAGMASTMTEIRKRVTPSAKKDWGEKGIEGTIWVPSGVLDICTRRMTAFLYEYGNHDL